MKNGKYKKPLKNFPKIHCYVIVKLPFPHVGPVYDVAEQSQINRFHPSVHFPWFMQLLSSHFWVGTNSQEVMTEPENNWCMQCYWEDIDRNCFTYISKNFRNRYLTGVLVFCIRSYINWSSVDSKISEATHETLA